MNSTETIRLMAACRIAAGLAILWAWAASDGGGPEQAAVPTFGNRPAAVTVPPVTMTTEEQARASKTAASEAAAAESTVAEATADVVVDASGAGNFRTISEAIESLPMYPYRRTVIFIRDGVYEEKLRIDRDSVTLRGESRDGTVIRFSQPRPDWEARRDWAGPAVINLHGDDAVIENLTVENSQPDTSVHAFAVLGDGTRTILNRCRLLSRGGDTAALWNTREGLTFHADCEFRGAVDMVCPRGWCYVRDSRFFEVRRTAAVWHAGSADPRQKLVIVRSVFDGVPGFHLGRRHYDAQFYFIDCAFSSALADRPVYRVVYEDTGRNNPDDYGNRVYFSGCRKEGAVFSWMSDNLGTAAGRPRPGDVTAAWTFDGRWDPESDRPVSVTAAEARGDSLILTFDDRMTVRGEPGLRSPSGRLFPIVVQRYTGVNRLTFKTGGGLPGGREWRGEWTVVNGALIGSTASVRERIVGPAFRMPSLKRITRRWTSDPQRPAGSERTRFSNRSG